MAETPAMRGLVALVVGLVLAEVVLRLGRIHGGGEWGILFNTAKNVGAPAAAGAGGAAAGGIGGKSPRPGDPIPGRGTVWASGDGTPLHTSPSDGSPVTQTLPPGTRLVFDERIEDAGGKPTWYQVQPPSGPPEWVSRDSVQTYRPGTDPNQPIQFVMGGKVESATVTTAGARG
jgi:Bacterial SH3 domain